MQKDEENKTPDSLEAIFESELFELLEESEPQSVVRTDEDRLIDSFEEINAFVDEHGREPSRTSMSEYGLSSRLDKIRKDKRNLAFLKSFDRHNLLGEIEPENVQEEVESLDDIFAQDSFGLLDEEEGDLSIFHFKHTPKPGSRAEAEYVAQRKPMREKDFAKYDEMFQQVHQDLKAGKRKLLDFSDAERNLIEGNFYLVDGLLCYLEVSKAEKVLKENKTGNRIRLEGRTVTIFENGTISNMLFRSLGKAIQKNGKLVTNPDEDIEKELFESAGMAGEELQQSGWVYILKTKSENPFLQNIPNLYKIGFTIQPVEDRIRNAKNEATYLYADVDKIASYVCYNMDIQLFENLIHRFFGEVCLDVELSDNSGNTYRPREWFIAPLEIIDEAVHMIINGSIVNYQYDAKEQKIVLK